MKEKVVLAYSGGLDTTAIIPWLKENFDYEVICCCIDCGQGNELDGLDERAKLSGASKLYIENIVDEFAEDYIMPCVQAGAVYENKYLLGTSMARPVIAKRLVEIARKEGAVAICHGATGKGNDQIRFELTIKALAPDIKIIAPWRMTDVWTMQSREDEIEYCKQLMDVIKQNDFVSHYPKVAEKLNLLEETIADDLEHLKTSIDEDAKTGHKTADTSFFGYKTHLAMTEERIITAATITSGEKPDGKELTLLVRKSRDAGMDVKTVIGDKAYSGKDNIEAAQNDGYELISRLNSAVTQGTRTKEEEFIFNKDAGRYQCKAGHLAVRKYLDKRKSEKTNQNPRMKYFFDVEKCKCCPYREGCYKEGSKIKSYSETLICDTHSEQAKFQETEYFKEKAKERYKIEAKNSELKHRHGYDVASSSGLIGMEMQGAMTIFAVNLKRIIKLMNA